MQLEKSLSEGMVYVIQYSTRALESPKPSVHCMALASQAGKNTVLGDANYIKGTASGYKGHMLQFSDTFEINCITWRPVRACKRR